MIEILNTTEHEDGSVTMIIDMSEEERNLFVEYAIIDLLTKYVDKAKKGTIDE